MNHIINFEIFEKDSYITRLINNLQRDKIKERVKYFLEKCKEEVGDYKESGQILKNYANGKKPTKAELKIVRSQLLDTLKIGGGGAILILPFGSILFYVLIKLGQKFNINFLPSAWDKKDSVQTYETFIKKDLIKKTGEMSLQYQKSMKWLPLNRAVKYVAENCTEFIERPVFIYRNIHSSKYRYFRSAPIQRVSRDCPNWYTLIMDNEKDWEKYPKRGHSFICSLTQERDIRDNYYLVIPENGSKWGVAPEDDIYTCFGGEGENNLLWGPSTFFAQLNDLSIDLKLGGISDDSIEEMKKDIDKLEQELQSNLTNILKTYGKFSQGEPPNRLGYFLKHSPLVTKPNLYKEIVNAMNPVKNRFQVKKYKDLKYPAFESEVWTESPCVFIKFAERDTFFRELYKYTHKEIQFNKL